MDKRINSTIEKYIHLIMSKQLGINAAYLFGSYAQNFQNDESDIDIALIVDNLNESDRFDLQVQLLMLASQVDTRIEPHPISSTEMNSHNSFAHQIMKTGIALKLR